MSTPSPKTEADTNTRAVTRAVLLALRAARNARGLQCPHCGARRIHRWGTVTLRQRYRCCVCRRTFSDLTGTPAAFSKRLHCWPSYCGCMIVGLSLRRTARIAGIHVSTAFRWRHALLSALERYDATTLGGLVEMDRTGFLYSEKGRRKLARRPRRRGEWEYGHRWNLPCVSAAVACDRNGNVASLVSRFPYPNWLHLRELAERAGTPTHVLGNFGPASCFALAAAKAGHTYHYVPRFRHWPGLDPAFHVDTVWQYMARLRRWLVRFRGVATRYLQHYLAWHRWISVPRLRLAINALLGSVVAHHALVRLSASRGSVLC